VYVINAIAGAKLQQKETGAEKKTRKKKLPIKMPLIYENMPLFLSFSMC